VDVPDGRLPGRLILIIWSMPLTGALPQLRYCHIDRADTGVELAVAVPVAVVDPLFRSHAVFSAADGVGLGGEDLVDKPLQHLPHQIRGGLSEQIIQVRCRVDRMRCSGHRHVPFGEMW